MAPEREESIDVFASNLGGEADLDLADLPGCFDLGTTAITQVSFERLCQACSVISDQ